MVNAKIHYYIMCISAFAQVKGLSRKTAFNYLDEYKGIAFLEECYEAEHCLSMEDTVDDLTAVCKNNRGKIE